MIYKNRDTYYNLARLIPSDINEHIETLYNYAKECNHITECGVRSVVSSWAFAKALLENPNRKRLVQVDLEVHQNVIEFIKVCNANNIEGVFYKGSDLECPIEKTDLLFIDTWHIYGHLKRELERWHSHVDKYIIMHDTTVDEWAGETLRCGWDAHKQSVESGIPVEEITKGLWPAIEEFLQTHKEWVLEKRYTNNNGLTILKRV